MRQKPRLPAHPHLAGLFASRGRLHAHRYLLTRDSHDLENAISTMHTAVALAKETQSDVLGSALGNLAALLLERAKSTGNDAVLNEALQLATWALDCFSDRDSDHVLVLVTLGGILARQYDRSGRVQDLEEAISSLESATRTPTSMHLGEGAFRAVVSSNLSSVLVKRYEITGRRENLKNAITAALKATEMEPSNYPPMMAGMGSNLASLLAKQYESTGALESLANALFELRIVAEIAPESPELDDLLGRLSTLAKEQHELRALPTTEERGVSQLTHSRSLTLFVLLSLSPVLSVVYPPAIYTLVLFFGGIACNWAVQKYQRPRNIGGGVRYLLHLAPTWAQKIFSLPDSSARFAPILFSTPWIDAPTASTWTRDEELFAEDRLWKQESIRSTHTEAEIDQGDNGIPSAPFFQPVSISTSSQKAQDREFVTNSQNQEHSNNLRDAGAWDNVDETSENQRAPSQTSDDGCEIIEPEDADNSVPNVSRMQIVTVEDVNNAEMSHLTGASRVSEQTKLIPDQVLTSERLVAGAPIPAMKQDSKLAIKGLPSSKPQEETPKKQDKSSLATLSPIDASIEAPEKTGTTHLPREGNESIEDGHSTLGKGFIDQKVHSREPPTKIDKDSSAFETVAQGHTENNINRNEGNAMGNIYSEEANVVGHLSRHYGDRFETKNISAVLRGYQDPEANQSLPEGASDQSHPEVIPQEVFDRYLRNLGQEPQIERSNKNGRITYRGDRYQRDDLRGGRSPEPQPKEPDEGSSGFRAERWSPATSSVDSKNPVRGKRRTSSLRGFPTPSPTRRSTRGGVLPAPTESDLDSYISDSPRVRRSATTGHRRPVAPQHPKFHDERASDYSESDGSDSLSFAKVDPHTTREVSPGAITSRSWVPKTKTRKAPDFEEQDEYFSDDYSKRVSAQEYIRRSRGLVPYPSKEPTRARKTTERRRYPARPSLPFGPDLKKYKTPFEQLLSLSTYYNNYLRPLCTTFVSNIPQDPKTRDTEYKRLSEQILQQVILNADGIEASHDEATRTARRTLIKQAHATLDQLDEAVLGSK